MRRLPASLTGYVLAIGAVAAAIAISFPILNLPDLRVAIPFIFLFAVLVPAWRGFGPGLFSCALIFLIAPFLFLPGFTLAKVDVKQFAFTVLVSLLVSQVAGSRRKAEELLRRTNEDLERRVRERTAELERSNAELEQYAYLASHDLQEPLRTVSNFASLFVRKYHGTLGPEADELLGHIKTGVARMQALVQDLLTWSRVSSDDEERTAIVDMETVWRHAVSACQPDIASCGAVVTNDPLPTIPLNGPQVGQVFQNLLTNAMKYSAPDRPPVIHVSARRLGSEWEFSVADNGMGIDSEHHDRIFGLFKRLHGHSVPGTGLGLSICKRIVEKHGGRIWVESKVGAGSTFRFTLRTVDENAEPG